MKKNLLKIYESFFDDLDKLNQDKVNDEFGDVNRGIYDEHDIILSPDKNPEFFEGLCNMCKEYYPNLPSNRNGFALKDLNQITLINSDDSCYSYFKKVTSLDELQYFHNLEEIHYDCFNKCEEIKSVIFPENLKIINNGSFADCISLEEIKIPNFLKEINKFAFYNCVSLEKIIIPKNIQVIIKYSFCYCTSLKEIIIPARFKDNMKYIFDEVDLTKVDIIYI